VILDEAQNTTPAQMRMALTRIGCNASMVVAGDQDQCDVEGVNGLTDLLLRLYPQRAHSLIRHVHLPDSDVVRSEVVKEVIGLYTSSCPR